MYTKPTLLSRFLLAVFNAGVGYLSLGLLLAYLGYDVISQSSVILHFKLDATAVIPGYFLTGFFVLPRFLASNKFRPIRTFIGGVCSFFLAFMFTILMFMGIYIASLWGNPDFSGELATTVAYFLGGGTLFAIALSPIGGFTAWIAYLVIYRKFQRGKFQD